jgi:hypothetical protein
MAIVQGLAVSFKLELLQAVHNFTTDTFWMALYGTSASLSPGNAVYTTAGEVTGTGYTAGGQALTITGGYPATSNTGAVVTFNPPTWTGATFGTLGAMIYNASKANRAVAILSFSAPYYVTGSNFTVNMPAADSYNAVVRIV